MIESHQSIFSEEVHNSLYSIRDQSSIKNNINQLNNNNLNVTIDSNNNSSNIGCALNVTSTNTATLTKPKLNNLHSSMKDGKVTTNATTTKSTSNTEKSKETVTAVQKKSSHHSMEKKVVYGTQTLKRKRDSAKSPIKAPPLGNAVDPTNESNRKNSQSTTATILVSKTKTKTGLPLLLKK